MSTDEKYGVLLRAAEIVASRSDRTALMMHHKRISGVIKNMLVGGRFRGTRRSSDGATKDNPTGNPFKKLRKATPTAVSSRFDESLNVLRAARDVPDSAFD